MPGFLHLWKTVPWFNDATPGYTADSPFILCFHFSPAPRHPNTSWEGIWTPKTYVPKTPSQEVFGCLGCNCWGHHISNQWLSTQTFLALLSMVVRVSRLEKASPESTRNTIYCTCPITSSYKSVLSPLLTTWKLEPTASSKVSPASCALSK